MKATIPLLAAALLASGFHATAAAWASANRFGGHTTSGGGQTEHTNAAGGSTTHNWDGGTSHTNAAGGTTTGAYGAGAVHTTDTGYSSYHPPAAGYPSGYRPPVAGYPGYAPYHPPPPYYSSGCYNCAAGAAGPAPRSAWRWGHRWRRRTLPRRRAMPTPRAWLPAAAPRPMRWASTSWRHRLARSLSQERHQLLPARQHLVQAGLWRQWRVLRGGAGAIARRCPGSRVSLHPHGRNGRSAGRQQAHVHDHIPRRAAAAGELILVGDDVRRQDPVSDQEPDRPLPHQLADDVRHEEECRRIAHAVHPEGLAGQGQASQLVAGARRPDLLGYALYWPQDTQPSILPAGEGSWKPPGIVASK